MLTDEQVSDAIGRIRYEDYNEPDLMAFAREIERLILEAERERCKAIYDFTVNQVPWNDTSILDKDIQNYVQNQRLGMRMLMEKLFPEPAQGKEVGK